MFKKSKRKNEILDKRTLNGKISRFQAHDTHKMKSLINEIVYAKNIISKTVKIKK